jgi:hypothetical protein
MNPIFRSVAKLLIVSLVSTLVFVFYYQQVFFSPNEYVFSAEGDGIKNYYTYLWHIKHDTSYVHFSGMNYPYGEVHLFTDGQPVLSNTIKLIYQYYPGILDYSVGITNFLMLSSLIVCCIFIFLILQRLKTPWKWNLAGALLITMLAPQVFRFHGHYGLSYAFFFPVTWYLLIRSFETGYKLSFNLLIALTSLFWFFFHPYLGLISSFFVFLYWLVFYLQKKPEIKSILFPALIQSSLAVVIYISYTALVDIHPDRTSSPWGMFFYNARWETVFMPHHPPVKPLIEMIFPIRGQRWEGWSYIGFAAVLVCFYSVFRIYRYGRKKHYSLIFNPALPDFMRPAVWASVLLLLFAMAYPFKLHLEFLLDFVPPLKQFRGLGRFAWVFYFVINIYVFYFIYQLYRSFKFKGKKAIALAIPVVYFGLMFSEAHVYQKETGPLLAKHENPFVKTFSDKDLKEVIDMIDPEKYQAIIPLPYYLIGSENFGTEGIDLMKYRSQVISYHTGLPIAGGSLARTSISESKKLMQLLSPSYIEKEYRKDLKSTKPFLIINNREWLSANQYLLMKKGKLVFQNDILELYELPLENLINSDQNFYFDMFYHLRNELMEVNGFLVNMDSYFYFSGYEDLASELVHSGAGALKGRKGDKIALFSAPIGKLTEEVYEISFWYYNKGESRNQLTLCIEEQDISGNAVDYWENHQAVQAAETIDGEWSLVSVFYRMREKGNSIKISVKGDKLLRQDFYIDNLLLKPEHMQVFKLISEEELFYNNRFVKK